MSEPSGPACPAPVDRDNDHAALHLEVLEPGLVVLRSAISKADQIQLATEAVAMGHSAGGGGFFDRNGDGSLSLNSTPSRGRIFAPISRFSPSTAALCAEALRLAMQQDQAMPAMEPTHLLVLWYARARGMGYHRDDGENDGCGRTPVVSFSLGNSCDFGLKHNRGDTPRIVRLNSGDAIVFGGPCRMMLHSVLRVHKTTVPPFLKAVIPDARVNFTFRYAPEAIGREETEFKYYRPAARRAPVPKTV